MFKEWLSEPRAIRALDGQERVLYVDNCSSHSENADVDGCLKKIKTEPRKLPPNATDLV